MSQRPQLSREIVMETIRAINIIAAAEEAGVDGTRTPGGVALNKQSQKIHLAAVQAVIILQANGLNPDDDLATQTRSEEHTSELQSLMRNSYAVFCLKKKKKKKKHRISY